VDMKSYILSCDYAHNLRVKTMITAQPASPGLPGKWPLKQSV